MIEYFLEIKSRIFLFSKIKSLLFRSNSYYRNKTNSFLIPYAR
ncbi:hypothetical protein RIEPE_0185 [Candidatus Riesia pediculicola USDA]|uniref:Uncharacterized protein n=1 Tax=Riesia pediculicola (strain USDA) TaxID=515618 RepID=D4G7Z3_RIEPU|nr:hypothetical protein RIEPE_0185 [Candidatus Riesia pediculicola USDA]